MDNALTYNDLTLEGIVQGLREIKESLRELNISAKETDKKFQDTDKKFQETERIIKESAAAQTDKKFQETDKQFKATDKKIKELSGLFTTQWGKLMESIIEPSCLKIFKDRGIDIRQTYSNLKTFSNGKETEHDIVLANGDDVVVVSVKTTFRIADVDEFLVDLSEFKDIFPLWKDKNIFGAVAGIKYDAHSDKYAYRKGMFVLKNSGEGIIKLANSKDFVPTKF